MNHWTDTYGDFIDKLTVELNEPPKGITATEFRHIARKHRTAHKAARLAVARATMNYPWDAVCLMDLGDIMEEVRGECPYDEGTEHAAIYHATLSKIERDVTKQIEKS